MYVCLSFHLLSLFNIARFKQANIVDSDDLRTKAAKLISAPLGRGVLGSGRGSSSGDGVLDLIEVSTCGCIIVMFLLYLSGLFLVDDTLCQLLHALH